jgi:hypothetical protein
MRNPALILVIAGVLLLDLAPSARAGVALFGRPSDTIEVSGQTVFGTASTYEAVILFPSALSGTGRVFNEWQDFVEDKFFAVAPGPSGAIHGFYIPLGGGVLTGSGAISTDQWHHVAYVYDGSEERLYLDGTLLQSRAVSGDVADGTGSVSHVGAIFRDGAMQNGFVGLIDVLRLSDVARYAGSSFTPPSPDLTSDANTVLLYTFDEAPGSQTVADASSLARTGTPGAGFGGATSPSFCGSDATDADADAIPDACDPDPPASTTTTTTATSSTTTTSTLPGGTCDDVPVGPTFASIICRLDALVARVTTASDLGAVQAKVLDQLGKSRAKVDQAASLCRQASRRKTRNALRPAIEKLAQARKTLGSRKARSAPQTLRDELRAEAAAIRDGMRDLQRMVVCPQDAP